MRVTEATWAEFKSAIGERSVAEVLGRYVDLEVARAHQERVATAGLSERDLVDALARAEHLTEALRHITRRLEARLPPQAPPRTSLFDE